MRRILVSFKQLCAQLETKIQSAYENGVTLENAEKLAGEFLGAQLKVSTELRKADLDSRMRKSGVKAIRAAVYMEAATKSDKKPTEAMLSSIVDVNDMVQGEQNSLDSAEVERDDLKRYYDIFTNAHIFFRGVAKGNFGG